MGKTKLEDLVIKTRSYRNAIREYMDRQDWWGEGFKLEKEGIYCKMFNPLHFIVDTFSEETKIESYKRAILDLIKNRRIFSVSVNNRRVWRRVERSLSQYTVFDEYKKERKILTELIDISKIDNDGRIKEMARIAVNDEYHYNYMEVRIITKGRIDKMPLIKFGGYEMDGETIVIGYEISFPSEHSHLFNLKTYKKDYQKVYALWVPENYNDLISAASMRKR